MQTNCILSAPMTTRLPWYLRQSCGSAACPLDSRLNHFKLSLHLCASVTKLYNMVPAKGRWCFTAREVTAGLAESNGSLQPSGWLTVTCGLTACTLGSAPGPTLGIEYGKAFTFTFTNVFLSVGTAWSAAARPPVNCACVPQLFHQLITGNTLLCPAFLRKFGCQLLCCVPLQTQTFYQNLVLVAEYHVDCWQRLQ